MMMTSLCLNLKCTRCFLSAWFSGCSVLLGHLETYNIETSHCQRVKPRLQLHARNMLLEATCCAQQATCCRQQATCCPQHVACCPQQVARPRNLLPRLMLRWCKRGIRFADGFLWPVDFDGRADSESAFLLISSCCCVVLCSNHVFGMVDHKHVGVLKLLDLSAAYDTLDQNDHSTLTGCPHEMFDIIDSALGWMADYLNVTVNSFMLSIMNLFPWFYSSPTVFLRDQISVL